MVRAHPRQRGSEGDDAEEAKQDDDGVEAGALPVTAAEMEPHPEFIESERHAEAVKQRADFAYPIAWPGDEDEQAADRGEEKDSVIEMVHMRPAEMQKQVWHPPD